MYRQLVVTNSRLSGVCGLLPYRRAATRRDTGDRRGGVDMLRGKPLHDVLP